MCIVWENVINITIKDIAKMAGVSHSTVSRSLNDSPRVKLETKDKIRAIAEKFDFEFNAGARSLSTRRTGTVGIIHPELYNVYSGSIFSNSLISEIMKRLDLAGIDSIPVFSENRENSSSNIRRLTRQQKVDAFIIVDSLVSAEDWKFISKFNIPSIQLHYKPKNNPPEEINYIYSDNIVGGKLATDYLIEHGCKTIMCITIKSEHPEILDRLQGFFLSMKQHNLDVDKNLIFEEECTVFNGEKIIRDYSDKLDLIDGIFVHADIMALGVINELQRQSYRVPEDIRVIGYDDIELGTYFTPKLTTIHQPKEILAEKACAKLKEIMSHSQDPKVVLQEIVAPYLVERES
ncbi:MAG: LacI family DNA-binding transcriptional regulator [Spirochaetia bacterium]|nr:LacI family DNA-binding transcriptional regulator [Spirochaetia bacterium]